MRYYVDIVMTPGKKMIEKNRLPAVWDEERVKKVVQHYEEQSEDEALAEDEAAFGDTHYPAIEVPTALVPAILQIIVKYWENNEK